jgi:hypothetical protein
MGSLLGRACEVVRLCERQSASSSASGEQTEHYVAYRLKAGISESELASISRQRIVKTLVPDNRLEQTIAEQQSVNTI